MGKLRGVGKGSLPLGTPEPGTCAGIDRPDRDPAGDPAEAVGSPRQSQISKRRPSLSCELFGAVKPVSRPQNWQSTVVPGTVRAGCGAPPSRPCANAFRSMA